MLINGIWPSLFEAVTEGLKLSVTEKEECTLFFIFVRN